jgi:hypothetical protein
MKAYDSVRREVLYNNLIEFGVTMKVVGLIQMCLNEMNSEVCIGKYFADNFPVQNGLKQGDALWPSLFKFALVYSMRKVQEYQVVLKLNGTHLLLVYADDVNQLGDNIDTIKKNTLMVTNKEIGLEVKLEKSTYIVTCIAIAKQWFGKHISTIEAVFCAVRAEGL